LLGGSAGEGVDQRKINVVQNPSGYDRVIGEDHETAEDTQPAGQHPQASWPEGSERPYGVALSLSADEKFGEHEGNADGQDASNVKKNESGAAILAGDVGIAPDIAKADRGSYSG
jgi:hypothetical protein